MSAQDLVEVPQDCFTRTEAQVLRSLQTRYQQEANLFSEHELAQLRFLRWLYQTSRLAP